jgi:hypothetical protein
MYKHPKIDIDQTKHVIWIKLTVKQVNQTTQYVDVFFKLLPSFEYFSDQVRFVK